MTAALCAAVLLCGFSVPAYAYAGGGEGGDYGDPTMETPAPEPTITPGEGFSEEGNLVTRDLLYDEHTNKQFITVQTSGGNTFYIVIDYDKPVDEEGCPTLSAEEIGKLQSSMASDWRKNPVPYPSYLLTNNNANIRRTRQRIEDLKSQSEYAGWAFPRGRAEINEGENRLQLFFEEKPSEEQRRELKSNGFKWAPSQGAWQRQLTKNAIYAAGRIEFLRPEDGQSPYQLQPFARKTEKDMTR